MITTKVSGGHLGAASMPEACEQSLRKLGTDRIDLYQIHWPSRTVAIAESMAALERLREQGKSASSASATSVCWTSTTS